MRVLLFGNNRLAADVAGHVRAQGDEIVGVVLHPPARRGFGDEIVAAAGVGPERVVDASRLDDPETLETLSAWEPEIGVSILFGYILRRPILSLLPRECVNLHPALLPWNRGAYPNVWSIVEKTPAGATLHYVDEGIDTGDIVLQKPVAVTATDTGESLYGRLVEACFEVFREAWPLLRAGTAPRSAQQGPGTYHRVRDVDALDQIDLDRARPAGELLDIIRARTFPPHQGAFVRHEGKKVFLRLALNTEAGS